VSNNKRQTSQIKGQTLKHQMSIVKPQPQPIPEIGPLKALQGMKKPLVETEKQTKQKRTNMKIHTCRSS